MTAHDCCSSISELVIGLAPDMTGSARRPRGRLAPGTARSSLMSGVMAPAGAAEVGQARCAAVNVNTNGGRRLVAAHTFSMLPNLGETIKAGVIAYMRRSVLTPSPNQPPSATVRMHTGEPQRKLVNHVHLGTPPSNTAIPLPLPRLRMCPTRSPRTRPPPP
eukprot:scaffold18374_cov124-Isochrysis_galbana.AAC.2